MSFLTLIAQAPADIFGEVVPPEGVALYDSNSAGGIGLLLFVSNLVKLATVIAGLWVFFNFLLAGYDYITSQGDTASHNRVKDRITMSVIGLVIIMVAYTILALLGLLLTGEASYFITPEIAGPTIPGALNPNPNNIVAPGGAVVTP